MGRTTNRVAIALGGALLIGGAVAAGLAGTSLLQPHYASAPPVTSTEPVSEEQRFGDQLQVPKEDPAPTDFALRVTVIGKQCFGASCVYTYNVDPWIMSAYPSAGRLLTVVYTVSGGDQDLIGNFTINEHGRIVAASGQNVPATGPDGAVFAATPTQVIVK